ncbi:hypothetical protein D0469_04215 [Peribacillus saganii]|uniref:YlbE-like protein n=1 Tax=Peribacillus saganii TaxID=2303992 RepID=A0A372LSH6_9BACI|nr:YlbE-like family protein [Peribacillus saganii]RFU71149.1 hypothetical protein D0469_04215 [Peribacillus saganii]
MRQDLYKLIEGNEDMQKFLRVQPFWYRKLSRRPHLISKMETEAKFYFEKSIPHRVSKFSEGVQMASMMVHMFQAMNAQQ